MVVPVLTDSGRDDLWMVLPHLGAGGAQKVALIAASYFAAQGLKVKLVTLIPGHPVAQDLPDGIPLLELGAPTHRSWWARAGRFALAQLDKLIRLLFQLQLKQQADQLVELGQGKTTRAGPPGAMGRRPQLQQWDPVGKVLGHGMARDKGDQLHLQPLSSEITGGNQGHFLSASRS